MSTNKSLSGVNDSDMREILAAIEPNLEYPQLSQLRAETTIEIIDGFIDRIGTPGYNPETEADGIQLILSQNLGLTANDFQNPENTLSQKITPAGMELINGRSLKAVSDNDMRELFALLDPDIGYQQLTNEQLGSATSKIDALIDNFGKIWAPPTSPISVEYQVENSSGQKSTKTLTLNATINTAGDGISGLTATTNDGINVDVTTSSNSLSFSGDLATRPTSLFLNYKDKSTDNDSNGVLEFTDGTDLNAFIREFKLDGSTNAAGTSGEKFQGAVFDADANTLTLNLNAGLSDLKASIVDSNTALASLSAADVSIDTSSELGQKAQP